MSAQNPSQHEHAPSASMPGSQSQPQTQTQSGSTSTSSSGGAGQQQQGPHPILRMRGQEHLHAQGSHVKFDEAAIREHDKLRGTRQKIDEAKTPYVQEGEKASGGVRLDLGALNAELEKEKDHAKLPQAAQQTKHAAFEEKRRNHYNEMELVRKFKGMGGTSDEEDDEE